MVTMARPQAVDLPVAAGEESGDMERAWLLPEPASLRSAAFDRALRSAALSWLPRPLAPTEWTAEADAVIARGALTTEPIDGAATTTIEARSEPGIPAMPEILAAWRAIERELAGMTGDSPAQELLEANAMLLMAMYQRLYVRRMRM